MAKFHYHSGGVAMPKLMLLLLCFLICAALQTSASAAGRHPTETWTYYHFDGASFSPGQSTDGTPFIAVQEKVRPVVMVAPASQPELTALPDGAGVIAGICYLQSTGGKLGGTKGYKPYPRVPLLISSGEKPFVTVQTDDTGHFMAVLPTGTYAIGSGPFTIDITVERGITTLVPLRAGKRMVD
jgi:hypothetical protein